MKNDMERKGKCSAKSSEMRYFSSFIYVSNLVDIACKGNHFSWYSGDGRSMGRLDYFWWRTLSLVTGV